MRYQFTLPAQFNALIDRLPTVAPLCRICASPIPPESLGWKERVMWCPKCRRVVEKSFFKAPGWVIGVVLVLSTKVLLGL